MRVSASRRVGFYHSIPLNKQASHQTRLISKQENTQTSKKALSFCKIVILRDDASFKLCLYNQRVILL